VLFTSARFGIRESADGQRDTAAGTPVVMLNPARVDAAVDLAYGALILVAIALIATVEFGIGIAFGVGVFSAYVLHVVWKMARFDPDWMTKAVDDSVERAIDEQVGEQVADSMERAVNGTVEQVVDERVTKQVDETIGDQLDNVEARVEAVDERLDSDETDTHVTRAADEPGDR